MFPQSLLQGAHHVQNVLSIAFLLARQCKEQSPTDCHPRRSYQTLTTTPKASDACFMKNTHWSFNRSLLILNYLITDIVTISYCRLGFCLTALPVIARANENVQVQRVKSERGKARTWISQEKKTNVKKEIKDMCRSTNGEKHISCISGRWSELALPQQGEGILQLKRTRDSHTFYLERPRINKSAQKWFHEQLFFCAKKQGVGVLENA